MRARMMASCIVLIVMSLVLGRIVWPAAAQGTPQAVTILRTDISSFPDIRVLLAAEDDRELQTDAVSVYEDGVLRPVAHLANTTTGIQIAVVMDVAGNIEKAGASGQPVQQEHVAIIQDLVTQRDVLDHDTQPRRDRAMLIAPQGPTGFQILEDWTDDYTRLYNSAYLHLSDYAPEPKTALQTMLVEAMARMKLVPEYEGRPKFLVVLSDGVDQTSVEEITDVINRAESIGVTILTVKVGPDNMGDARNLQRMSAMTGGAFAAYQGTDSLHPLYEVISRERHVYELTYRSAINVAGAHSLRLGVAQGDATVFSPDCSLSVAVQPPSVEITDPEGGRRVVRETDEPGADPATLPNGSLPISIKIDFPDGYARSLESVGYKVNGQVLSTQEPTEGYVWDLSSAPSGDYTLQVEVTDELGLVGLSRPVQVTIDVRIPTLEPHVEVIQRVVHEEIDKETDLNRVLVALGAGLGGLALIMASYLFIKRPQAVVDMASTIAGRIKEATEPFLGRRGGGRQSARAYLYMMREDGSLGTARPITSRQVTLGRDPNQADIVFEDRSVSRYHARIVEESQGTFMVYDEGSTSGTYVNDTEVGSTPHRLDPGDILYLGRVAVRFSTTPVETGSYDETQAFQPPQVGL